MTGREALYGVIGAIAGAAVGYIVTKAMYEKEIDELYDELDEKREATAEEAMATYQGKPGTRHLASVKPDDEDVYADSEKKIIHPDTDDNVDSTRHGKVDGLKAACTFKDETTEWPSGGKVTARIQRPDDELAEMDDTPVYGAISCVDGVDVVFDETHKVWVTADEHVLWGGPEPTGEEDKDEQDEALADKISEVNDVYIIPAEEIDATRQVIGEYVHETGDVRIATGLTPNFKNLGLDEFIPNDALLPLIGEGAFEELMNADEDSSQTRLVCVRNNVLNLDFVISF